MSKTKTVKKEEKIPAGQQWIYIGKSLYSNQAAIDGRKNSWYWTLLIFILSIFIPWIPYLSRGYTANTSAILTSTSNNEIDKGFKQLLSEDYFKGVVFQTNDSGEWILSYDIDASYYSTDTSWTTEYEGNNTVELMKGTYTDSAESASAYLANSYTDKQITYYFDCISVDNSTLIDTDGMTSSSSSSSSSSTSSGYEDNGRTTYLEVYFAPDTYLQDGEDRQVLNNFAASVILNVDANGTAQNYPHSYLIMGADYISLAVYSIKSTKSSISPTSTYSGYISDGVAENLPTAGQTFYSYVAGDDTSVIDIFNNGFASFCDRAGRPTYIHSIWVNIGILTAVTAGTILVAGILMLIFSKRKMSLYRDTNFWQALTEGVNMSLSPAIIAMIIGWMSLQYIYVMIVGLILMRAIFSMNKLVPAPGQDSDNKPLYQARS